MGDPTGAEFFGTPTAPPQAGGPGLPTGAEFFAAPTARPAPIRGGVWDTVLSDASAAGAFGGRVLNAMGEGFNEQWGTRPLGLDPDTETTLKKLGIFNDYEAGHTSFLKGVNEAVIRPAAAAADLTARMVPAQLAAVGAGAEAAAAKPGEEPKGPIATAVAGIGELAYAQSEGLIGPEFGAHAPALVDAAADASTARAVGVIGEGEEGFYGAQPVSPENLQARADAARDAGIEPVAPEPPAPDIHALARRIDPETFEQYDAAALEREQHRDTIAAISEERANSPEALEAQDQIDTILGKVGGVESRLTNAARGRLADAQDRLDTAMSTDTPEMAQARAGLMNADFAMRDLAPQVSDAYRQAREMMPAETVEMGAAEAGAAPEAPREGEPPHGAAGEERPPTAATEPQRTPEEEAGIRAAPIAESAEGEAAVAPPNVLGETEGGRLAGGGRVSRGALKTVEGSGEEVTRGVSRTTEERALADGLEEEFGDLPTYQRINKADQAARAIELMDRDPDLARAVALGDRAAPDGLLPESVYEAVRRRATAEGDWETVHQLGTRSRLASAGTTMGQRISMYAERDPLDPVRAIREVQKAREAAATGTGRNVRDLAAEKAQAVTEARAEMRKAASKPDAWKSLVEALQCGE